MLDLTSNTELLQVFRGTLRDHHLLAMCTHLSKYAQELSVSSKEKLRQFIRKHGHVKGYSKDPLRASPRAIADVLKKIAVGSGKLQKELLCYWLELRSDAPWRVLRALDQEGLPLSAEGVLNVAEGLDSITPELTTGEAGLIAHLLGFVRANQVEPGATEPVTPNSSTSSEASYVEPAAMPDSGATVPTIAPIGSHTVHPLSQNGLATSARGSSPSVSDAASPKAPRFREWLRALAALPATADEWSELPNLIESLQLLSARKVSERRLEDALNELNESQRKDIPDSLSTVDWVAANCPLDEIERAISLLEEYRAAFQEYQGLTAQPPSRFSDAYVDYLEQERSLVKHILTQHSDLATMLGPQPTPPDPDGNGSPPHRPAESSSNEDIGEGAQEQEPGSSSDLQVSHAREPPVESIELSEQRDPLDGVEVRLREQIARSDLLAELDLSKDSVDELGREIAALVTANGVAATTNLLERQFPCALATFLVGQGIFHYRDGDFWTGVAAAVGIEVTAVRDLWGAFFERFILEKGLPRVPTGIGHRFVSTILLHSGVPDDSLDSFFEDFLSVVMSERQLLDVPMEDLIAEWLDTSAARHRAAQPVVRFLREGGDYAADFADRCRTMALHTLENDACPNPSEVGLPSRIIEHFRVWREAAPDSSSRKTDGAHYRRPIISIDPWGDGLLVDLPGQSLSTKINPDTIRWKIVAGDKAVKVPSEAYYRDMVLQTESRQAQLPQPAPQFSISLVDDDRSLRDWNFMGLSPNHPILVFDATTSEFVAWTTSLPARALLLMFPVRTQIVAADGQQKSVYGVLPGEWHDYRVEAWDLTNARSIQVDDLVIPVEPDPRKLRPYPAQGEILETIPGGLSPVVYVGSAPNVVIPVPPGRDWQQEVERWRISIDGSTINRLAGTPLGDLANCLVVESDAMHLRLAAPECLGADAFGSFVVELRGPLGRGVRFAFSLVPSLKVPTLGHVRVPDAQGRMPSVSFEVRTQPRFVVESAESSVHVTMEDEGRYAVFGSVNQTSVAIYVRGADQAEEPVVLLELPTPFLNWAIVDETVPTPADWSVKPLRRSMEWFKNTLAPRLLVTIRPSIGLAENVRGKLIFRDGTGQAIRELAPRGRTRRWLSFRLDEAGEDVQQLAHTSVAVELELQGLPGHPSTRTVRVLELNADVSANVFDIRCTAKDTDHWSIDLSWPTGRSPSYPHLRLWPLLCPWEKPFVKELTQQQSNRVCIITSRSELPVELYRCEVAEIDRWSSVEKLRPLPGTPGVVDLWVGTHDECRRRLVDETTFREEPFRDHLALLILDDLPLSREQMREHIGSEFPIENLGVIFDALMYLVEENEDRQFARTFVGWFKHGISEYRIDFFLEAFGRSLVVAEVDQLRIEAVVSGVDSDLAALLRKVRRGGFLEFSDLRKLSLSGATTTDLDELAARLLEEGVEIHGREDDEAGVDDWLDDESAEEELTGDLPDIFRLYLRDVGRVPLLTQARERELAKKIRDGQSAERELADNPGLGTVSQMYFHTQISEAAQARQHFVEANLRLVISIARHYLNRGMTMEDLVQEGNIGLLRAVERFDPDRGFKFSTYATWWVRQGITRAIDNQSQLIRVPVHAWGQHTKLIRMVHHLTAQLGRDPTDTELADALSLPVAKIRHIRDLLAQVVSLDQPIGDEEDITLAGSVVDQTAVDPEEAATQQQLREAVHLVLSMLDHRDCRVLRLRFGLDDGQKRTLEAIGRELGLTRERIRQIEARGLKKLRHSSKAFHIKDFVNFRSHRENATGEDHRELSTPH